MSRQRLSLPSPNRKPDLGLIPRRPGAIVGQAPRAVEPMISDRVPLELATELGHRFQRVEVARRPVAPVPSRSIFNSGIVIQRHEPFHKVIKEEARTHYDQSQGLGDAGLGTHHKISQAYLATLSEDLDEALKLPTSDPVGAAARRFFEKLKEAKHSQIAPNNTFTMLNNLPLNLEVGPHEYLNNPGHLFDPNSEPIPTATEVTSNAETAKPQENTVSPPSIEAITPPRPRLQRQLTARSIELRKINTIVQGNVTNSKRGYSAEQWDNMTRALTAALQAHHAVTGDKNVLSSPKTEQWVNQQNNRVFNRLYPADIEQEHREGGAIALAASKLEQQRAAKEQWRQEQRRQKVQAEYEKERNGKLQLLLRDFENVFRNSTLGIDVIDTVVPKDHPLKDKLVEAVKDTLAIGSVQKKRRKMGRTPAREIPDLLVRLKKLVGQMSKVLGWSEEDSSAENEAAPTAEEVAS